MKRITPASLVPFLDRPTRGTMHLVTRQVPEIDGSQGAFIGLVVALSVLIVVCCAAVFYLLRHHEPTDQDRAARRERYRRAREHTLNTSSSFAGPSTSTVGLGSLSDKVKHLWQSTTGAGTGGGGRGRRGGRGWIRAGSDDEWASHSDHEGGADPELGGHLRSLPVLKQDTRGGTGEGDVVRVVESPSSDTTSGFAQSPYAYAYTDPYSKTPSHGALQRSQSPLSSPVSSPRECASGDESPEARSPGDDHHHDHRHRSTMSNASVWTHAGSKFVEDI